MVGDERGEDGEDEAVELEGGEPRGVVQELLRQVQLTVVAHLQVEVTVTWRH